MLAIDLLAQQEGQADRNNLLREVVVCRAVGKRDHFVSWVFEGVKRAPSERAVLVAYLGDSDVVSNHEVFWVDLARYLQPGMCQFGFVFSDHPCRTVGRQSGSRRRKNITTKNTKPPKHRQQFSRVFRVLFVIPTRKTTYPQDPRQLGQAPQRLPVFA